MSEYVTKGAMMKCTGGAAPSKLQVTSNTAVYAQGNAIATVSDKAPMVNIMPFGACKLKPFSPPCVPAPTAWMGFHPTVQLPGGNPLLKTSKILCACGGIIEFQNSGQMKSDKVILNPTSPQIEALKQAAINATPFCEECEKKAKEEKKKQPKVIDIYWIDEENDYEIKRLSALDENKEVTLFIDVENAEVGDNVDVEMEAPEGISFEGGKSKLQLSAKVEEGDNGLVAIIEKFSYKFE